MKEKVMIPTISLRSVLVCLASLGKDTRSILAQAQLDRELIDGVDAKITLSQYEAFWEACATELGDNLCGLKMSQMVPFGTFSNFDFLLGSSSNVKEAIEKAQKYYPLVNQGLFLEVIQGGDSIQIRMNPIIHEMSLKVLEFELGLLLFRLKNIAVFEDDFFKLGFCHGPTGELTLYQKILKLTPQFDQDCNYIEVANKALMVLLEKSNTQLLDMLEANAQKELEKLGTLPKDADDPLYQKLVAFIKDNIVSGKATIEDAALHLNMSSRTLQRKLKDKGYSYTDVMVSVRREIALNLMKDQNVSLSEIAYLCGFSESSAFHRAFKQWMGKTPQQFRKQKLKN